MCNNPYCSHNIDKTVALQEVELYKEKIEQYKMEVAQLNISSAILDETDLKWDKDKAMYNLILSDFLNEMAVILTKGEKNHPKINGQPSWQLVEPDRYIAAMYRHIHQYRIEPGSLDGEMQTDHMAHVAINAMFLWWFGKQDKDQCKLNMQHNYEEE